MTYTILPDTDTESTVRVGFVIVKSDADTVVALSDSENVALTIDVLVAAAESIVGGVSDGHDRYNKVPHSSYEFKIPVELIGKNIEYGLYIAIYDFHENRVYSWPKGIILENNFKIPSPQKWGTMISLDKTLPEFEIPIMITILSLSSIVIISRFSKSSMVIR